MSLISHGAVDLIQLCKNEKNQILTFALFNKNFSPIEFVFVTNNYRLKKNGTAVLVVLREIQNGGENRIEPRSFVGKCKKLRRTVNVIGLFV